TLSSSQIAALSTSSVAALETRDLVVLKTSGIAALNTAQVNALTTAQVAKLTTDQVVALTSASLATGFTTDQIVALTALQAAVLSSNQVAALSSTNIAALETTDLAALITTSFVGLTTKQMGALTTAQAVALTSDQASVLNSAQVAALSTSSVAALETSDLVVLSTRAIAALTTQQIIVLGTNQIQALTTNQVAAITTTQVMQMTTAQIQAFTTDQISHLALGSPLILDLNKNGKVDTLSIADGVKFDLYASGEKVNTGWVGSGDGLLVMDRNHDGVINDGKELFGTSSVLSSGEKAADGYAALAGLDSNQDGTVDVKDDGFNDLRVWLDENADGVSQASELKTLASLDIAKLNLDVSKTAEKDNGNFVGLKSTYQSTDGSSHAAADVWFVADNPATAAPDMRSKVVDLVQAISAFEEGEKQAAAGVGALKDQLPADTSLTLVSAEHVGQMTDLLKQFDANGKLIESAGDSLVSAEQKLHLNGLGRAGDAGILAVK
ncbi:hypothetical protein WAE56_17225, partial [Iodobacter sp. LRB]